MPKNWPPDCECVARSLVVMSKARDVYAFFIEISMLPSHAPSMRTCATRLPPSSATAMFIGCLISAAFFSAAAMTLRASSSLTIFSPGTHEHLICLRRTSHQPAVADVQGPYHSQIGEGDAREITSQSHGGPHSYSSLPARGNALAR